MIWYYLMVAGCLFGIGLFGVMIRRNVLIVLLCIELMLTAVNLIFASTGLYLNGAEARIFVFFVLTISAAEVAVGLSIVLQLYRRYQQVDVDDFAELKW